MACIYSWSKFYFLQIYKTSHVGHSVPNHSNLPGWPSWICMRNLSCVHLYEWWLHAKFQFWSFTLITPASNFGAFSYANIFWYCADMELKSSIISNWYLGCEFELLFCLSMILIEINTPEVVILFTPISPTQSFRGPLPPGYSSKIEFDLRCMPIGASGKECSSALSTSFRCSKGSNMWWKRKL